MHDIYGHGSVLLWRRSDTLCKLTSGFADDVIFVQKPRLLEVAAQLNPTAHAALGLAIKCAQLQANGRTGLLFGRLNYVPRLQHLGGVYGL